MSDMESIRPKVIQHIVEASDADIEAEKVTDETSLQGELELGSLQAVTLVMDLEDEFGVEVEDEELEGLQTVGDILQLIHSKTASAST